MLIADTSNRERAYHMHCPISCSFSVACSNSQNNNKHYMHMPEGGNAADRETLFTESYSISSFQKLK
jgi:hypothetical protein